MISLKSLIICGLLISQSLGAEIWNHRKDKWNYSLAGSDWPQNKVLYVNQCGSVLAQSPINIPDDKLTTSNNVRLTVQWYNRKQDLDIKFKHGALRSEGTFSILRMKMGVLDIDYYSTYMEFHAPGENELHGQFYDLEVQIYHRLFEKHATRTQIKEAVISVLFRKSYEKETNPFFEQWNFANVNFDGKDVSKVRGQATLNIQSLSEQLEDNTDFYNFQGSYTRPPCTENLNWFVFDKVLDINVDQLKVLNQFFRFNEEFAGGRGNAREIQNLGTRKIYKGQAKFVYPLDFEDDDDDEDNNGANLVQRKIIQKKISANKKRGASKKHTKIENLY